MSGESSRVVGVAARPKVPQVRHPWFRDQHSSVDTSLLTGSPYSS